GIRRLGYLGPHRTRTQLGTLVTDDPLYGNLEDWHGKARSIGTRLDRSEEDALPDRCASGGSERAHRPAWRKAGRKARPPDCGHYSGAHVLRRAPRRDRATPHPP